MGSQEEQRQPYMRAESPHLPRALARHSSLCFITEAQTRASCEAHLNVRTSHSPHSTKIATPNLAQFDAEEIVWLKPSEHQRRQQEVHAMSGMTNLYPVPPSLLYIELARWPEGNEGEDKNNPINECIQRHLQPRSRWFHDVVKSAPNRRTMMNRLRPCVQQVFGKHDFTWPIPHTVASAMFQPRTEIDQLASLQNLLDRSSSSGSELPNSPPRNRPLRPSFVYWHLPKNADSDSPPPVPPSSTSDGSDSGHQQQQGLLASGPFVRQSLVRADRNFRTEFDIPNPEDQFLALAPGGSEPGTFSSGPQEQKAGLEQSLTHYPTTEAAINKSETMGPKVSNVKPLPEEEEEETTTDMEVEEDNGNESGSGSGSDSEEEEEGGSGSDNESSSGEEEGVEAEAEPEPEPEAEQPKPVIAEDSLAALFFGESESSPAPAPTPAPPTKSGKNLISNLKKKGDEIKAAAAAVVAEPPAPTPTTPAPSKKKKTAPAKKTTATTPTTPKVSGKKRRAPEPSSVEAGEDEEEGEVTADTPEPPAKKKKTSATTSTPTKAKTTNNSNGKTKAQIAAEAANGGPLLSLNGDSKPSSMSETLKFIRENTEDIEEHREELRNLYISYVQRINGLSPDSRYKKIREFMLGHFKNASPDVILGARWMMKLLVDYGMYLPLESGHPYGDSGNNKTTANKQEVIDLGLLMVYFGQVPNTTDECFDLQEYRDAWNAEELEKQRLQEEKEKEKKAKAKAPAPAVKKQPKIIDLSDMPDPFAD